jgi:Condensation domain
LESDPKVVAEQRAREEASMPFDLTCGPLLRVKLLQVDASFYYFLFTIHHIISDGWSMQVLAKDIRLLYSAALNGQANPLTPLGIQYKDYAHWQQLQLSGKELDSHQSYWMDQLSGELPVLNLPIYQVRPAIQRLNGKNQHFSFSASTTKSLTQLGQQHNTTLFTVMISLLNTLLYKYTGQQDILIGTDSAGRSHVDLEEQVGYYLNLLILRSQFLATDSFVQLLGKVTHVVLDAHEHQLYSFELIVEQLRFKRDRSRLPLEFQ